MLSMLPNKSYEIISYVKKNSISKRLMEMGLTVGCVFKVVRVAPFGDPYIIQLRGYQLMIRKYELDYLKVKEINFS